MVEEYRIIKDFPNYEVSNFGNVRNVQTGNILKYGSCYGGYYCVKLYKDGNKFMKKVHRLIATSFIQNPYNKNCVDHIDGNRRNNNINNLRFVSTQENCMNRKKSSLNSSNHKGVNFQKKNNKWCARITKNGIRLHLGYFDNIEDAVNARVKKAKELYGDYINSCEKEITINLNIPENIKVNLNINIKSKEEQELEDLEKELNEIINKK